MENNKGFEPRIVAFCCNWCSYAGADLAGGMRLKYAPNILPIRVMCSGRISPHFILKAFQKGADGVLVTGCHIGDCHYMKGNYITAKRVAILRDLLGFVGINPERLKLEWIAGSEGWQTNSQNRLGNWGRHLCLIFRTMHKDGFSWMS